MANQLCACDAGLGNLGLPNCDQIFRAGRKFIFVPKYSAAGVENSITPSGTINLAWITALVNQTDKSLRFYFTPKLKKIELIKGDATFEPFEDKSSQQIGMSFEIPNSFDDSTMCMIKASAFPDFNMNDIGGLIDGNVTFS